MDHHSLYFEEGEGGSCVARAFVGLKTERVYVYACGRFWLGFNALFGVSAPSALGKNERRLRPCFGWIPSSKSGYACTRPVS